jgi:hypothetical protein
VPLSGQLKTSTRQAASNGSSKGSNYIETNITRPLTNRLSLGFHLGRQEIRGYQALSYFDWRVALEFKPVDPLTIGGSFVDTNADKRLYIDRGGINVARPKWVWFLRANF